LGRRSAFARRARVHASVMLLAAGLLLAVASSTALAKQSPPPGVHLDPGSPAAKEYAIPLAQARAGGGSGGSGSGQLFGHGITRAPSPPASAPVTSAPENATAAPTGAPTVALTPRKRSPRRIVQHVGAPAPVAAKHRARPVAAAPAPAPAPSGPVRAAGSGAGIAWMLGVAALVLALGGLGGAVLARHGRRTSARTS